MWSSASAVVERTSCEGGPAQGAISGTSVERN